MRRLLFLLIALGIAFVSTPAYAQFPPKELKNLKVFPKDISVRALLDTMGGFTRALGVRCTYCHVGEEGQPLSSFDFPSDKKPEKDKAREMLRMVGAINGDYLTKLVSRRTPAIVVACATCHRGITEPRPLQQVVLNAYDSVGADSAEALYRALRTRYYGRAAYDFGEVPLVDVGNALRARGKTADALRFYILNTQMLPTSGFAFRSAAEGQLAAGDTASAIRSYQQALTINPNDRQAKGALERLGQKP
ncbi:MAG TPA: c-type cytochrome [Gemmatimonadaceae bacterium]|jgi:tetratricopeptide (TPR) repeat protein